MEKGERKILDTDCCCNLLQMVSSTPYTIMYVYAAELLPTTHRNVGVSSGNAFSKLIGGVILPQIITSSLMMAGPQEESKMMMYSCGVSALMASAVALMLGRETVGRVMTDSAKESTDDEVLLATHRSSLSSLAGYQSVMD
jgi:sugar phosphate permease